VSAYVVAARRSPIGTAGHAFADVEAARLAAPVLAAVAEEARTLTGRAPDEVVLGNCMGPGGDVARVAALAARLQVPALTVDRQCASGLAAVVSAVAQVQAGSRLVLAGGVESASTAPWRFWPPVDGGEPVRYERAPFAPAEVGDPDMGEANDRFAQRCGVGRERQDAYAAESHRRAHDSLSAGRFAAEVVEVGGVTRDERPRAGLTAQRLGRLRPAFRPAEEGGTVTAGNSCGVNDGAAVVAVVDEATRGTAPALRVLATATVANDPDQPGWGLVPATRLVLERAGRSLDEVDVVELNEAFAGQVLACCDELGLDPARVCPEGGALGLGHPWGASGAVLVVRLHAQLVRSGRGGLGLAAIAAGGGQGVAVLVEAG
jgi:acetyl-CoA C-acetyltransferase